jgi:pimeloyl-ACP methyl ester carboxylesterase
MKLRLYHHPDGARIAYRETGTGPPLVLLHAAGLSHREWEPIVEPLSSRFRLVMPDLPLHGDSEDRTRHPYSPEWLAEVLGGFCTEAAGPRPIVAGHGAGAELLLAALGAERIAPSRVVLMPSRLHRASEDRRRVALWRVACRAAVVPGLDRVLSHAVARAVPPAAADRLCVQQNPAARDLLRHAFADVAGNANRARSWARLARQWPKGARREFLDLYPRIDVPVLLLWADSDALHPVEAAQEALDVLPDAQLRVLAGCGHLLTYDDPVGVAREISAFCR